MTCTHGAPHMTHAPGARCPWCGHTIATGEPRTALVAAAGEAARPPVPAPAASSAPEVSAEREQVGGTSPVFSTSGAAHRAELSMFGHPTPTQGSPADPLLTEGDEAPGALAGTSKQQRAHDGLDGPVGQDHGSDSGEGKPALDRRWGQVPDPTPPHRHARNTDPQTSLDAARSITELRRRADHDLVLALLFEHGPLTDFDLARLASQRCGHMVKQTSLGVRRGELRDAGLVVDSGHKGRSDTGARAIRWALTDAGSREVAA